MGLKVVLPVSSALLCVVATVKVGQAQVAGPSPVYSKNVPDDSSTTVGPGYTGLDPSMIVRVLEKSGVTQPKSEYETSADYQRRISTLPSQAAGGFSLDGNLAFVLNGPSINVLGSAVESHYDADKQLLGVRIKIEKKDFGISDFFTALDLQSSILQSDRFVGQNSYGATAEVTSIVGAEFGLTIENETWLTPVRSDAPPSENTGVTLQLRMTSGDARDLADHLRVLLICRLTSPWLRQRAFAGSGPTVQSPYDGLIYYKYLHIEPEALWIFDERDGKVIAKFTGASLEAERNRVAQERRTLYPLKLEIERKMASDPHFTYQADDQPEQSGTIKAEFIALDVVIPPLVIEAKKHIKITLDPNSGEKSDLSFTVNGVRVKPKWHKESNAVTRRSELVADFELP